MRHDTCAERGEAPCPGEPSSSCRPNEKPDKTTPVGYAPPEIVRITPDGEQTAFTLPADQDVPCCSAGIVAGPDGVYFPTIGVLNPSTGMSTYTESFINRMSYDGDLTGQWALPAGSQANGIVGVGRGARYGSPFIDEGSGRSGELWFTLCLTNCSGQGTPPPTPTGGIGHLVVRTGEVDIFPTAANPSDLTLADDGNLWVTEPPAHSVVTMAPDGTVLATHTVGDSPDAITTGPDGNVYVGMSPVMLNGTPVAARVLEFVICGAGNDYCSGSPAHPPVGTVVAYTPPLPPHPFPPQKGWGLPGLSPGPDGNVWFTGGQLDAVGNVSPSGELSAYDVPDYANATSTCSGPPGSTPPCSDHLHAITLGGDGNLWMVAMHTSPPGPTKILRLTPDGQVTGVFPLPLSIEHNTYIQVFDMTLGPDGNVWFVEPARPMFGVPSAIGRITPDGTITSFFDVAPGTVPYTGVTTGPDGNIWFTAQNSATGDNRPDGWVERMSPDGTLLDVYHLPTMWSDPGRIAPGPHGTIWVAEQQAVTGHEGPGAVARIDISSGTVTEFPITTGPNRAQVAGVTEGGDRNIWFTEYNNQRVGRMAPDGTLLDEFLLPAGATPDRIVTGSDGNVYLTDTKNGQVDKVFVCDGNGGRGGGKGSCH